MRYLIGLLSIFFFSCSNSIDLEDAVGTYVPENYENNFDTITLRSKGVYHRKVYDSDGNLVLNMKGKWMLGENKDEIRFRSFYLNLDDDLVKFPESVQDTSGGWSGLIEKEIGEMKFCLGYYSADLPDQNCYKKIR